MSEAKPSIRRVREPSALRRGRLAVDPVWYVDLPNGQTWKFQRRKDARIFAEAGGCWHTFDGKERGHMCWTCGGYCIERSDVETLAEAVRAVERDHPLPRCEHGNPLRDHAGTTLAPSCGCGERRP